MILVADTGRANSVVRFTLEVGEAGKKPHSTEDLQRLAAQDLVRRFGDEGLTVMRIDVQFDGSYDDHSGQGHEVWGIVAKIRIPRGLARGIAVYQRQYGFCPDPAADEADMSFLSGYLMT